MSYTIEQLNALEVSISQGVLRTRYSDKEVQFRSVTEMLQLRDVMRKDLGLSKPSATRLLAKHSKGL